MDTKFLYKLIQQIFEDSPQELTNFQSEQHAYGQKHLKVDACVILLKDTEGIEVLPCFQSTLLSAATSYLQAHYQKLNPSEQDDYLQTILWMPKSANPEQSDLLSYGRLPLILNGELVGCVILASQSLGWSGDDLSIAEMLVHLTEVRLENWMLKYYQRYQGGLLETIQRMTLLINDVKTPLQHILEHIVAEAVRLTGAGGAQVNLLEGSRHLRVAAEIGEISQIRGYRERIEIGQGFLGLVAEKQQTIFVDNYHTSPYALASIPENTVGSGIGVPLLKNDLLLGVLGVFEMGKKPLTPNDQFILEQLGALATLALSQTQLHNAVEHEHNQLRAILDYVTVPILLYDSRWRLVVANPEAYVVMRRLGLDLGDFIGKSVNRLFKNFPSGVDFPRSANFNEPIEVRLGMAGDFFIQTSAIRPSDGITNGYVVVAQSVTAERELHQTRRDLLHVLSHDLGNILSLALGYTSLMVDAIPSPEDYHSFIRRIFEALNRGKSLIRDVVALEHAKTQGQQILKPYRIDEIVEQVIFDSKGMLDFYNHNLTYEMEAKPQQEMIGNIPLLKQSLENIINNAIKYTPEGGQIEVKLTVSGDYALITVQDNGIGIPANDLQNIWKRFYRVDSAQMRAISGTGLGLNLVHSVITEHGGYVEADSELGKGSLFSVYLPIGFNPSMHNETPQLFAAD